MENTNEELRNAALTMEAADDEAKIKEIEYQTEQNKWWKKIFKKLRPNQGVESKDNEDIKEATQSHEDSQDLEYLRLISDLNEKLSNGERLSNLSDKLSQIDKPILVDFNNVLANNEPPIVINPEAQGFLQELQKIGTVVIVTTAESHSGVKKIIDDAGIITDNIVIIVTPNYKKDTSNYESATDMTTVTNIREKYTQIAHDNGFFKAGNMALNIAPELQGSDLDKAINNSFKGGPVDKKVAPFFMKDHLIPIIDDAALATTANLGTIGLNVNPWYAESDKAYKKQKFKEKMRIEKGRKKREPRFPVISLDDATIKVREHYSNHE
jgi:hypothetical protein